MKHLTDKYQQRFEDVLYPLACRLKQYLCDYLSDTPRIDRISTRAKSVERFVEKAMKKEGDQPKYHDAMSEIQDQIGARIVTFYMPDVENISRVVLKYFRAIEQRTLIPEKEWEFGYFGRHLILFLPDDIFAKDLDRSDAPKFFELQIKTLFQHAWSEANHDLGYKPTSRLTSEQKRLLAFTAAQAWGADDVVSRLYAETLSAN